MSPAPTLPKGGGAIRGIGETFSANSVTGTGSFSVPIATSPSRSAFHPELTLAYDSGAGNGPFGHGFHLSVPQVARKTEKGLPRYDDAHDSDVFVLSGAEDLVPWRREDDDWNREIIDGGTETIERYRPRVEGLFARIEQRRNKETGIAHWTAVTKDNVTSTYGRSEEARIADPDDPRRIFRWLLEETRDDKGNVITYSYKAEDLAGVSPALAYETHRCKGSLQIQNRYLKRIRYGNTTPGETTTVLFEVVFDYGEHHPDRPTVEEETPWPKRQDAFSTYRSGFEIRTYRLCQRVLMFHRLAELGETPCLVRSTDFTYSEGPVLTQLVQVTHTGYVRDPGTGDYQKKSHPPVDFGYSLPVLQTTVSVVDKASTADLPGGVQSSSYQWLDLDGDGLPGVLCQHGEAIFYKQNLGGGELKRARLLQQRPTLAQAEQGGARFADLDGDGRKELALFSPPLAGYQERNESGGFGPFHPFSSPALLDFQDPNLRFIDLSGDGHEDLLITRGDHFLWVPSLAKGGFAKPVRINQTRNEDKGPAVVFADGTQTIFLADMSGDGLTDLVRIRNGQVCYWPNLGYGRFGAKVVMGGAPHFDRPDHFDPRRLRLADVDGSGTTDVLYVHRDGVRVYENQSGNSLGAAVTLPRFPDMSDFSSVSAVDLLGTGTACLVWSTSLPSAGTSPLRYMDLLGGKKPYLLTSVKNNLGLETKVEYAPSTRFSLEDAAAGRPWVTRLTFPVQVLTRVESYDAVSRHRFISEYKYHHGHYDGVEREFRGFAMVEQWDTESFARASGAGLFPEGSNEEDPELHLPPVHTKTWFHTGAFQGGAKISQQLATEYYSGDTHPQATLLPDTLLPAGLSTTEQREACRALRGQILRQEVYALDGTAAEPHPYTVSERSYEIIPLQPAIPGAKETDPRSIRKAEHGVFFAHPREAIEYHYERNPDDPRVTHAFTLEVDRQGTVIRTAAVAYPRRSASGLPAEQTTGAITLTEQEVFHADEETDWYRLAVPIEARSYALTGLAPSGSAVLSFEAVFAVADEAEEIPYEAVTDDSSQKRLLSQTRHLYTKNDLSGPLAQGEVESLALPYATYAKAFTPALLTSALGGRATEAILEEGGYLRFSPDEAWWVPSGRQVFSAEDFYLPVTFYDAFGNATSVVYDDHDLFVTQVTDPLGNVVQAAHDYRVLSPALLTDPNGNRGAARFDELGMVIATAVMGKAGSEDGDTLDDPTTTFDYDLDRYRTTGLPNVVHARARELHGDAGTRWQETYSYSDGSGHEVMRKVQAEPGDAPARDEEGALIHDEEGALVFAEADPRWVGTGRTVLDNKGHPVKQYEPFFSATHDYEDETELVAWGVTPILRYDPVGRLVRTDLPNGTFSKVVFDPWKQTTLDPNDTVLDSVWWTNRQELDHGDPEWKAADRAADHAETPSTAHLDALGRTFLTEADNGTVGVYATRLTLDIEGNPLVVTDARDNEAMRHVFGMGGSKLYQKSCDAGERWMLLDVAGQPLRTWDERGFTRRAAYDALRRGTHHFVQKDAEDELLVERVVYGEGHADPAALNLRGKVYRQYDGAGVVTTGLYDFKGNLLQGARQVAVAYTTQVEWSALMGLTDIGDLEDAAESLLEAEVFTTQTVYDALNRPVSLTTPDSSEVRPTYNEASLLEKVEVRIRGAEDWTSFVDDIDYDAKGQREKIVYGNGTATTYSYDPLTFRLTQLRTVRGSDDAVLQNLSYTYDPVGNITAIADSAQQTVFFNNAVVTPSTEYVYDALYRLIEASGREHAGGLGDDQRDENDVPLMNLPHANDSAALRSYTELYGYDEVGNILSMIHQAGMAGSWTRRYEVAETSNRLLSTSLPGDGEEGPYSAEYAHDAHGNVLSMPHLAGVEWDYKDQMMSSDLGGGGTIYYTYDAAGQRVRKVWEHSGLVEERIYLGGYEVYRKRDISGLLVERETLHVMDGVKRVALVETKTVDTAEGGSFEVSTVIRYQMGNHLGSAVLEVDEEGAVISYEEYHPYGTTAYCSGTGAAEVSRKRYRYTGKEKDEGTGLYYHGARYYACWLGRWTSADPAGMVDGPNLYEYVTGNPVRFRDPTGEQTAPSLTEEQIKRLRVQPPPTKVPKGARAGYLNQGSEDSKKGSAGIYRYGIDPKALPAPPPKPPEPPRPAPAPTLPRVSEGSPMAKEPGKDGAGKGGEGKWGGGDDLAGAAGLMNMQQPLSDQGVSGGIPGGFGPKENASGFGQALYAGLTFLGGSITSGIEKGLRAVGKVATVAGEKLIDKFITKGLGEAAEKAIATGAREGVDAAVASAGKAAVGGAFSVSEMATINEARQIPLDQLRAAFKAGGAELKIGSRTILVDPGVPSSGMTLFGENGFVLGREAFTSEAELAKTLLHELHRLNTSQSAAGVTGGLAAEETNAAFSFAERAYKEWFR
ncbi:MAG: SpvB/TcaC N-terminal domain-containing protein [Minicystis sp.]